MSTFSSVKKLLSALYRGEKLLTEMFKKRKSMDYKYEYALDLLENNDNEIQYLLKYSIIRQNGNGLEINDLYLQFFEQVLDANEEVNTSYIDQNIAKVKQNINYYFNESNEYRSYEYLRIIKNTLRKIGDNTLRNIIDLKRNIDNTFKNEPNYKNKKAKLINLDDKRKDITKLIEQTEYLITQDNITFFKTATDEELNKVIVQLKTQLGKCTHNLIEIERQIIIFLNQIQQQGDVVEKLRQIKYLKDQFTLETATDIRQILASNNSVIFEPNPSYSLKLSLDYLQTNEEVFVSIKKIAKRLESKTQLKQVLADNISDNYLQVKIEEEVQINFEEVKNGFIASSHNLFDFVMNYNFGKNILFDERVTIYCQIVSLYDSVFKITKEFSIKNEIEYAIIYPK